MTKALRDCAEHRAIHEAISGELRDTMAVFRHTLRFSPDKATDVADVVLSIWQERVLPHATAEEESLYANVDAAEALRMVRDHDLMRIWVAEAREGQRQTRTGSAVIARLEALLLLLERHERDEEAWLATVQAVDGTGEAHPGDRADAAEEGAR